MTEWKVMLNGKLWTDRFDSKELAIEYVDSEVENGVGVHEQFEILTMSNEDISVYYSKSKNKIVPILKELNLYEEMI